MNFRLPHIPRAKDLIDQAFRAGAKQAKMARGMGKKVPEKILTGEIRRVETIGAIVEGDLLAIVKHFPDFDELDDFQRALLSIKVERDRYKKSLATIQWASQRVKNLKEKTLRKLKKTKDTSLSGAFLARTDSFLKRAGPDLDYMIGVKGILLDFPVVADAPTLVVAGIPNAGKSTFTRQLTGSKVKIAPYPFTTVNILIGYKLVGHKRYQIVDSPGILDRAPKQRNNVEKQAMLALSHLADAVLFIFDQTQPHTQQNNLLSEIRSLLDVPVNVFANDKGFEAKPSGHPIFNAMDKTDCERVFEKCFGI